MATFTLLNSGAWRAQVRRKGAYAAETFFRKTDAQTWAREAETAIDQGLKPPRRGQPAAKKGQTSFGELVDLHIADMEEVGKELGRSKRFVLRLLKAELGRLAIEALTRERLLEYGRERASGGAGPVTLAIDFSYLHTVLAHAAAVHGVVVSHEPVMLARTALVRLGLIGKSIERDRRPTQDELDHVTAYLDGNPRQRIPVGRMVRFGVATAMRIEEICRIRWADLDQRKKVVLVRDRKDPRNKEGNHMRVPLLDATGYDAWALIQEQGRLSGHVDRIFPYSSDSAGAAFHRACVQLKIEDLHFHDLRHEATSRLFEFGFEIPEVALVTGHKDWKTLKRYTHLKPEALHDGPRSKLAGLRAQIEALKHAETSGHQPDNERTSQRNQKLEARNAGNDALAQRHSRSRKASA